MNSSEYICSYENCSATFHHSERYETHLRKHTGERPFICTFEGCDKTYARSFHLKRHQETHEKMFKCTLPGCSKILKTKATLMKHQDVFHSKKEARKYKCPECSEVFVKRSMLARHNYVHSGVKDFKCSEPGCDKSFSMLSRLKKHAKSHVGYYCEVPDCFKYFHRWSLLRKHKKECHPKTFRCHICEKVFKYACNLKAHCLTHILEKDIFRCSVPNCIRAYQSQRSLSAHLKTFHETFTIACPEGNCHRFVKTEKELEIHIQRRHRRRLKKMPKKPEFAEILSGFAKGTKKDLNPHLSNVVLEEEVRESNYETIELKRINRNSPNNTQGLCDKQCLEAPCSQKDSSQHLLNTTPEETIEASEDETSDIEVIDLDSPDDEKQCTVDGECLNLGLNQNLTNFDDKKESKGANINTVSLDSSVAMQIDEHSIDAQGLNLPLTNTVFEGKVKKSKDKLIKIEVVYHNSQNDLEPCSEEENCSSCRADQLWISTDMP